MMEESTPQPSPTLAEPSSDSTLSDESSKGNDVETVLAQRLRSIKIVAAEIASFRNNVQVGHSWMFSEVSPGVDSVVAALTKLTDVYSYLSKNTIYHCTISNGYFAVLPGEVVLHIFSFLDSKSLARCSCVCQLFHRFAYEDKLWQAVMEREVTEPMIQYLKLLNHSVWRLACRSIKYVFPASVKKNGFGTFNYPDGAIYHGELVEDQRHGKGIYVAPYCQLTYIGSWVRDKKDGWGVTIWPQGKRHEGYYQDNMRNGNGKFTWPNGHKYEGNFKDDKRHGKGVFTFTDGSQWEGEFQENERWHGTYTWPNNSRKYTGYWKKSSRHGEGQYWWPDGCTYTGNWVDDKRQGSGRLAWADGCKFEGMWHDSKRWGDGVFYDEHNNAHPQEWREQVFNRHDRGKMKTPPSSPAHEPLSLSANTSLSETDLSGVGGAIKATTKDVDVTDTEAPGNQELALTSAVVVPSSSMSGNTPPSNSMSTASSTTPNTPTSAPIPIPMPNSAARTSTPGSSPLNAAIAQPPTIPIVTPPPTAASSTISALAALLPSFMFSSPPQTQTCTSSSSSNNTGASNNNNNSHNQDSDSDSEAASKRKSDQEETDEKVPRKRRKSNNS
ncbi:morn repeat protein [Pelomyxa schiedti]|nr:morn repeat protein [Pelomyxa schiedti]